MCKRGMVLAAGRGERMRPLTDRIPKPLIEVSGRTLLDRALDALENGGVAEAVVNVAYKAEMIEAHLAGRVSPRIRISREETALETGGGIKKALPLLGEDPFFALNSDTVLLDGEAPALRRLTRAWREDIDGVLLLHPAERATGYAGRGDFFLDAAGRLTRRGEAPRAPFVFTGAQLLHPRIFRNAPEGVFSMNVLYDRNLSNFLGVIHDGGWLHVGDADGLKAAETALR